MLVPEFFADDELTCHCGCGLLPPQRSVERLYALRLALHRPLSISSAARCRKHSRDYRKGRPVGLHGDWTGSDVRSFGRRPSRFDGVEILASTITATAIRSVIIEAIAT
jgi:hypothetical protein